jgi:hypothetical protein
MAKTNEDFERDWKKSVGDVNRFADMQKEKAIDVNVLLPVLRPSYEERMKYTDKGDMIVSMRVEHKCIKPAFTSRENYPHPTVYIDEPYKVQKKHHIPLLLYVLESSNRTHAAIVYGYTADKWTITEKKWDEKQNSYRTYYQIEKRFVRFCKLEDVFIRDLTQ